MFPRPTLPAMNSRNRSVFSAQGTRSISAIVSLQLVPRVVTKVFRLRMRSCWFCELFYTRTKCESSCDITMAREHGDDHNDCTFGVFQPRISHTVSNVVVHGVLYSLRRQAISVLEGGSYFTAHFPYNIFPFPFILEFESLGCDDNFFGGIEFLTMTILNYAPWPILLGECGPF